ncbi:MFS transporter [Clostridium intestinale]|uniref:MFS transporter n=1 Tax=Clostridium intestinale TaxID=36845 RepID=A0A7D6VQQ1_9CLOT|nr:MFS transporter [Clostridium intestinale]QLY78557.1 MFS transporter [Clostridium intestinale]
MTNKISSYKIYLLFSAITAMYFSSVFTVSMVYHIEKVHLNPLQLILVGTTLEAACFIFEIPTGIVSDVYSRKLSIIIGTTLIGLGFIIEASIPKFIIIIISQIVWGIGYTFISGSIDAWIAEESKGEDLNRVYIKGAQAGQIGSVVGIVFSTILGNLSVRIPIALGGAIFIMFSIFLWIYMSEGNFTPSAPDELNTFRKMGYTFKSSVKFIKSKPIIMLLLSVTLFYGLASEGYDRLYTAHFLQDTILPSIWNLSSVTWFGIFGISGMLLNAGVMQVIVKRLEKEEKINSAVVLIGTNIFYIIFMLIFALTKDFKIMLMGYLLTNMFRTINGPIFSAWLNNHIDEKARATVISTNSQINALGQIIGGPIIGIIATNISVSIGIAFTALLVSPVIIIYLLTIFRDKRYSLNSKS